MKHISSLDNSEIKSVASLAHTKYRYQEKKFMAEGIRTISTLKETMQLVQLYTTQENLDAAQKITDEQKIALVSDAVMKKMSQATTPSGIIGIFELPEQPRTALTPGIVLANITDPGNMGTLIRTCAAMNVHTVVVVEGVDPWHPKVIQASAGTIAYVTIHQMDWHTLVEQKGSLDLYALVVSGGTSVDQVNAGKALLVIGNEAHGIAQDWIQDCDEQITIAMPGKAESLNAAIAGSIAVYTVFSP